MTDTVADSPVTTGGSTVAGDERDGLDARTYDVLRTRLGEQARELARRAAPALRSTGSSPSGSTAPTSRANGRC